MNDLELQDELRGRLFAKLVAAGVRKISIDASDLYAELGEPGPYRQFEDLFCDMISWLQAEGLLRYQGLSNSVKETAEADFCQITSLGLSLADQPFNAANATARDLAQSNQTDGTEAYTKLGAFVGTAVGKFISSI